MAHYAKIEDGIVVQVIVAEQDFIDTQEGTWVQTSYNTHKGEHLQGGTPLRKNFAAIGMTYDADRDAFIPEQNFDSWVLDENTCTWVAPIPVPDESKEYVWNDETESWVEVTYLA